jgi:hypothetical protein
MAITTDNAIIDYNTITNIVDTLNTQNDVFTAFQQQALVVVTDQTTQNGSNNLLVGSTQFAGVRATITPGYTGQSIAFSVQFASAPIVNITVETTSTKAIYAAQFSFPPNVANSSYGSVNVIVINVTNPLDTTQVVVHVTAVGQKQ